MNIKYVCLCLCSLLLVACSETDDTIQNWLNQTQPKSTTNRTPKTTDIPITISRYTGYGLSPFDSKRLLAISQNGPNAPDANRPRDPLENYELERLKMVGSIAKSKQLAALIRTPDGQIYTVRVGQYIGMQYGQIQKITEYAIQIIETVEDLNGSWTKKENSLQIEDDLGQNK